ncbi:hypothetical protein GCM10009718_26600 [Isoptericola halotolerans]|uniref:Uncharacterized protein n=1 Tax=Isoptericola halotolerans TaxID=300560 RepID=A0ABX2A7A2_9MICO|nr:hypothetical protein [Isoptericola halotolerans]NOV97486.1 hypothetical protein [Isoptericola halotolerans]
MRTPLALGAAVLLALGLGAGPAAATGGDKAPWQGPSDTRTGASWSGGTATEAGVTYGWPTDTRSWNNNVCPDMDELKKDVSGDQKAITLTAPEGKLISAYCVKAGSAKKGEGPKIVVLDEPQAEVTISYVTGNKCKGISHYSVAYVDAPGSEEPGEPEPTATPTPGPSEEPGEPEPTATPTPDPSGEPEPTATPTPSGEPVVEPETDPSPEVSEEPAENETPGERPQTVVPVEVDGEESAEPRPSEVVVDVESGADSAETVNAQSQAELPQTGPGRAIGIALGAIALLGTGTGAVLYARSRRATA